MVMEKGKEIDLRCILEVRFGMWVVGYGVDEEKRRMSMWLFLDFLVCIGCR